jgi:hypothetical protein
MLLLRDQDVEADAHGACVPMHNVRVCAGSVSNVCRLIHRRSSSTAADPR